MYCLLGPSKRTKENVVSTKETLSRYGVSRNDRQEPLRRPILQRRSSLFSTIQALADAFLVGGLAFGMSWLQFGGWPKEYLALCVLLIMSMGIVYDRMGVYRNFRGMRSKSIALLKAWSAVFGFLLSLGFLLKTSSFFSRQYLLLMYTAGYGLQLAAHWIGYRLVLKARKATCPLPA